MERWSKPIVYPQKDGVGHAIGFIIPGYWMFPPRLIGLYGFKSLADLEHYKNDIDEYIQARKTEVPFSFEEAFGGEPTTSSNIPPLQGDDRWKPS